MSNNANINSIPKKLINECCFCHKKGLKPGVLAQEFKQDIRTQEHFSKITKELALNSNGMCNECEAITNKNE